LPSQVPESRPLGAVYAGSAGLGGEEAGGLPELLCGELGAGVLGSSAGTGEAGVEE